jgi:hypothetical protein
VNEAELEPLPEPVPSPDIYPVYPEDDGTDRPRNPYSQV